MHQLKKLCLYNRILPITGSQSWSNARNVFNYTGCMVARHNLCFPQLLQCSILRSIGFHEKESKRIEEKMKKMLKNRPKMRKKFCDVLPVKSNTSQNVSLNRKYQNKLNKSVLLRDQTRANIVLKEVQEVIDSGIVSDELSQLHVQLTTCTMTSKNHCLIQWELQGSKRDFFIQENLNRFAGEIRHYLIHSHIISQVPTFHFFLSDQVMMDAKVRELLDSGLVDMGPLEDEDQEEEEIEEDFSWERTKKKDEVNKSMVPTYSMFGIDQFALEEKILNKQKLGSKSIKPEKPET
uniref:Uncharacterized LOC100182565 n=1 Tax=Ciona intestinalis TaxID=7719 RepID=F6R5A5_CIOIN|nr:uncharacterized protein LOC100182565 [Ciona intestinalis]|eukprot:XP_002131979.1 uncharacterized protein LOC100182565 [Ciona intestinalis]